MKALRLAIVAMAALGALALIPATAPAADALSTDAPWVITGDVVIRNQVLFASYNITVASGGRLTVDHSQVIVQQPGGEDTVALRVRAGGTFMIINGSSVIASFASPADSVRFRLMAESGSNFTLADSSVDGAFGIGIAEPSALIDNVTISHSYFGLYGYDLHPTRIRFAENLISFWLSANSSLRDSSATSSSYFAGVLDDDATVYNTTFSNSQVADLLLLDRASSFDTTHTNSGRGAIVNQNASMTRATMHSMLYSCIQVGAQDLSVPSELISALAGFNDGINMAGFPPFYRQNNSVFLQDVDLSGCPAAISFDREVWRKVIDETPPNGSDPGAGVPLFNTITWLVTQATRVQSSFNHLNGSVIIRAGGRLELDGGRWDVLATNDTVPFRVEGGELVLSGVTLNSKFIDYASDSLVDSYAASPRLTIEVAAGSMVVRDSNLRHLGPSADPQVSGGIVLTSAAASILVERSLLNVSARAVTMACCAGAMGTAAVADSRLESEGPAVVIQGGLVQLFNVTVSTPSWQTAYALSAGGRLELYNTAATVSGPAPLDIVRFAMPMTRTLWLDGYPVPGALVNISVFGTGAPVAALTAGPDGWAVPPWIEHRRTAWDGGAEVGNATTTFAFQAQRSGLEARNAPVDISNGEPVTLVFVDAGDPFVGFDSPDPSYTIFYTTTLQAHAGDAASGLIRVEMSKDNGPFLRILEFQRGTQSFLNFSVVVTDLTPGRHLVTLQATDASGHAARADVTVIIDQRPPDFWLDFPTVFYVHARAFNLTGTLTEPGAVLYNGSSYPTDENFRFSVPAHLTNDTESFTFTARDLAGNGVGFSVIVTLDDTPPLLEVISPPNGTTEGTNYTLIDGRVERNSTLILNGVLLSISGTTSFTLRAGLAPGENILVLEAVDAANNRARVTLQVFSDSTPPPLTILEPSTQGAINTGRVRVAVLTEPGVTVRVGDVNLSTADGYVETMLELADGYHTVSVSVIDAAGHEVQHTLILLIDTVAPRLYLDKGWEQSTSNATLRIVGVTDPYAHVVVGGLKTRADAGGTFVMEMRLHPGRNTVPVESTDAAGNKASSTLVVMSDQPGTVQVAGGFSVRAGTWTLLAAATVLLVLSLAANRMVDRRLRRAS